MKHTHLSISSQKKLKQLERRRLKASKLFEKGVYDAEVARRCQVSRVAAHNWRRIWKKSGKKGLKAAASLGRKSKLTENKIKRVRQALLKGPKVAGYATEIWTLERIAKLIRKTVKVSYHPGNVWRVLRSMGWSCQKPEKRAKERNEKMIQEWMRVKWPSIQKGGRKLARLSDF